MDFFLKLLKKENRALFKNVLINNIHIKRKHLLIIFNLYISIIYCNYYTF